MKKDLAILGTRGIPARHGGFETFAERLALYLVKQGWRVTVYCQADTAENLCEVDEWKGVRRVTISTNAPGAWGTMAFDFKAVRHVIEARPDVVLTLGYNTAVFSSWLRLSGINNIFNMDGLEWQRIKWSAPAKVWLWLNERIGCLVGNHLIADHPSIADHLATRVSRKKITTIVYGADRATRDRQHSVLSKYDLAGLPYGILIARPEAENSILEIVTAFSQRRRQAKLMVLGSYDGQQNAYHQRVLDAASEEVIFPGAIYDHAAVSALRANARFYLHGHQVGGTNPSLVEALGAGCAVIAHNNRFNRWVAGDSAKFFSTVEECNACISELLDDDELVDRLSLASVRRFEEEFQWNKILTEYERLLEKYTRRYPKYAVQPGRAEGALPEGDEM
jgi:glycosyltransferase involved in cell wall biosynthesis